MAKIESITVQIEPLREDTGGLDIFRDPQGQFHKIEGIDFFVEPPPSGCRHVLAEQVEVAGRERVICSNYSS